MGDNAHLPGANVMKIAIVFLSILLFSQVTKSASFYPLELGNSWEYVFGSQSQAEKIVDTTRIHGRLYYGFATWSVEEPAYWLRYGDDVVYILNPQDSTEHILYNFKAEVGSSWQLPLIDCIFNGRITLASKNDTLDTPAGTFTDCYRFIFADHGCDDAARLESWFCKGIGQVRFWD